jgi:hypothetical protein
MEHIVNVLEEAASQQLITMDELKTALRIPSSDSSKDAELQMIIDTTSLAVAKMCNRSFGFEKVRETFYNEADTHCRMFFSRWPVKLEDIESFTMEGIDQLPLVGGDWVLEQKTGTLYRPVSTWYGKVDCVYSGGYKLPDEVPDDLKRAVTVAARDDYYTFLRGAIMSGVRMLSHKHARVMFYPSGGQTSEKGGGAGSAGIWNAVNAALRPYTRHWI